MQSAKWKVQAEYNIYFLWGPDPTTILVHLLDNAATGFHPTPPTNSPSSPTTKPLHFCLNKPFCSFVSQIGFFFVCLFVFVFFFFFFFLWLSKLLLSGFVPELLVLICGLGILGQLSIWGSIWKSLANGNVVVWLFWLRELLLLWKMRSQTCLVLNLLGALKGLRAMSPEGFTRIWTFFLVSQLNLTFVF